MVPQNPNPFVANKVVAEPIRRKPLLFHRFCPVLLFLTLLSSLLLPFSRRKPNIPRRKSKYASNPTPSTSVNDAHSPTPSTPFLPKSVIEERIWILRLERHTGAIDGHLREVGLTFHLLKDVLGLISKNIEKSLVEAFTPLEINDWNSIFWITHPGGPVILDQVESKLGLKEEKMRAMREALKEYGNMSSACVLFILDEMRWKSMEEGRETTGEGFERGVLFGFGLGLTVETVVLRSQPAFVTN